MWTRRQLLITALSGAATALLPRSLWREVDLGRPGDEWIAEAQSIDRHAWSWGPEVAHANAAGLLSRLDAALAAAPRAHARLPLHLAAAIAGSVAARSVRWAGDDPSQYLSTALFHAEAARDGVAKAVVLDQQAAIHSEPARISGLPSAQERELAVSVLSAAGAATASSGLRAGARWRLAWDCAASGDPREALREAECALIDGQRGGWDRHVLHACYGEVLDRCGRHVAAQQHLARALSAPPVRRVVVLTHLALSQVRSGDADAACCSLEEATHLAQGCRGFGRIRSIRVVRGMIPPGPHRDQLDDVLRG